MARIAALLLAFLAATSAFAGERRVDELVRASGLEKQVAQIEPLMNMGIDDAQAQAGAKGLKATMAPAELARVRAAIKQAFGAEALRQSCRDTFAAGLTAEEETEVLAWLSTGLGRHITAIEESQDHTSRAANAQRDAAVKKLLPTLPASRIALLQRLARATLAGDSAAGLIINTTVGTTYGVAAANPPLDTTMVDKLRKRMEAERPQMAVYLHNLAVAEYAYTYRALLNEELERYVTFAESPAGKRYHLAAVRAMDAAFARGSIELGLALGALEKREARSNS